MCLLFLYFYLPSGCNTIDTYALYDPNTQVLLDNIDANNSSYVYYFFVF